MQSTGHQDNENGDQTIFSLVVQDDDFYFIAFESNSLHRLVFISEWLTPKQGGTGISHLLSLIAF